MCLGIISEPSNVGTGKIQLDVFTYETFYQLGFFTDIYIITKGAKNLDTFSDEYDDLIKTQSTEIERVCKERLQIRKDSLLAEANPQLESAQSMVNKVESLNTIGQNMATDCGTRLGINATVAASFATTNPILAGLLMTTQNNVTNTLSNLDSHANDSLIESLNDSLDLANEAVTTINDAQVFVNIRQDSIGFSSYDSNVGKVGALAKIFPVFFFVVALLVALTTMTRLVEENRTQIGTLKALGYSNGQVLGEYLLYSLSSSILGCILGFAVGFVLFPSAISSAYDMMFVVPKTVTPFRLDIVLWVAPVTIGSIIVATILACWNEFRACPAELVRPKAPAAGKRIWLEHIGFIWNHLNFTLKVTCRNLFRYKKRFFMTVIGVAGCSALLLTGFGVKDSVNDIVDKQFGEVYRYDLSILTNKQNSYQEGSDLRDILDDNTKISKWLGFYEASGKVIVGDSEETIAICVPQDPSKLPDFITLQERKSGKEVSFPTNGIVLTEKLCETLNIQVGDSLTIENVDGLKGETTLAGITENYVTSYAYMSDSTYNQIFNKSVEYTTILCCLVNVKQADDIVSEIMSDKDVIYVTSVSSLKDSFNDSINSINGVVLVLILAAGLLCIVVLYNLTNVNICERRKELATIRVLGFHKREVEQYIFRETNLLSLFGTIVGLGIGIWLHSFVVRTVEVDQVMFGRNIYPQSYLYALLISMIFTLVVNQIMKRQIHKVDMVEAMKAND